LRPATAANGVSGVEKFKIGMDEPIAAKKSCVPVDFATAALVRTPDRILLKVSGQAPHAGMTVEVHPVLYVAQPDYWLMSLVACALADAKLSGDPVPFNAEINLAGSVGRKGIELSGKPGGKSKRLDLP